jgi:hypothetical protein
MLKDRTTPNHKRRWFQFRLRTLLLLMLLASIGMSWVSVEIQQAKREREAAAAVIKLGGGVNWDDPLARNRILRPRWFPAFLDDFLISVHSVSYFGSQATDAGLEHLGGMRQLVGLESQSDESHGCWPGAHQGVGSTSGIAA